MASRHFLTWRIKLRVNQAQSAIDRPQHRTFLGFSFTVGGQPNRRTIAPEFLVRFKARRQRLTRRTQGLGCRKF
jgi:RNA-directed DNA polymerase